MGIPHEPATLFVYALLAVAAWAIWRGSRTTAPPPSDENHLDG